MGDALKRPAPSDDGASPDGDVTGQGLEVTGVHPRGAHRPGPSAARSHPRVERPDPGATLVVLRHGALGQRSYSLGPRPVRRLVRMAWLWLLVMACIGGALRVGIGPDRRPLQLGWARVRAGAHAVLPLTGWARVPEARRVPAKPGEARERAEALGLGTRPVASHLLRGEVDERWVKEAERLGKTPTRFLWPVARGWFVRGFGSGTGGYHLAVDVAGEEGSTVRAAADGIVAYADDGVRGFGNLLMLVHGGGFVTMYAHNQTHGVEPGDFVQAGAPIATLGNTGISRGPHVHFELIHDGRNCDPVPLFEPGVRHRERGFDTSRTTEWEGSRPRAVRCDRRKRHPHSRWGVDGHMDEPEALEGAEPVAEEASPTAPDEATAQVAAPAGRPTTEPREERSEREVGAEPAEARARKAKMPTKPEPEDEANGAKAARAERSKDEEAAPARAKADENVAPPQPSAPEPTPTRAEAPKPPEAGRAPEPAGSVAEVE